METSQSPQSQLRVGWSALVAVALLAAVIVTAGVILGTRSGGEAAKVTAVMPGHGAVMPSDVSAIAAPGELKVMLGDYWLKPSARRLKAGAYVLTAENVGVVPHDIMIEKAPIAMAGEDVPIDDAAPYGLDRLQTRVAKRTRVILDAGTWVLFCSVPGHYAAGQHAVLKVYGSLPKGMQLPEKGMGSADKGSRDTTTRS